MRHAESPAGGLARTFVSLADTMVADFDVTELLDRLVLATAEVLDAESVGVLLSDQGGNLQVMASSSEQSRLVEVFQLQTQEGPSLDCYEGGTPVTVPDLASADERWPSFVPAATALGFRSVHALPLRLRSETIGALNVFDVPRRVPLNGNLSIAQELANVATIGILQHWAVRRAQVLAEQLQHALSSRVVIEQAKGILAAKAQHPDMDEAFARLRHHARNHNARLSDLAHDLVAGRISADAILSTTPRS